MWELEPERIPGCGQILLSIRKRMQMCYWKEYNDGGGVKTDTDQIW